MGRTCGTTTSSFLPDHLRQNTCHWSRARTHGAGVQTGWVRKQSSRFGCSSRPNRERPPARSVLTPGDNVKPALAQLGLRESELALFFDQLPSGVVLVDEHGYTTAMNGAARRFLGSAVERSQSLTQV